MSTSKSHNLQERIKRLRELVAKEQANQAESEENSPRAFSNFGQWFGFRNGWRSAPVTQLDEAPSGHDE